MKPKILLVDNLPEFLEVQARLLVKEGYDVSTASKIEEAETLLREEWFHLVIIDQRMEDDDNEHDISGLILACQEEFRKIPKFILTAYPDYESTRKALATIGGYPSAIDYIAKSKSSDVLNEAIERFLTQRAHINWNLPIDWKGYSPHWLVAAIESRLESKSFLSRTEELVDLMGRLFYEKEHISIEHLLWQAPGKVAIIIFAFKEDARDESFIVVCGQNAIVQEEANRFDEFAPKAPGENGTLLAGKMRAETMHFAANAYVLVGNDLEKIQTLVHLYGSSQERLFKDTLNNLFQKVLHEWHPGRPIRVKDSSLQMLYRKRLKLLEDHYSSTYFNARIKAIESQIATLGVRIHRVKGTLRFDFSNRPFSFPDPLLLISRPANQKEITLVIHVPGTLSGENILTDNSGHVWLTDFAEAGLAPLFWNYVAMESAIRFDWVDTNDLLRRYELEHSLLDTDFANPDTRGMEPIVGKPARAIAVIRKLAARVVGNDTEAYHTGIFFHAMRRLANFDPARPLKSIELARLGHILISMSMIAGKLEQNKANVNPVASTPINQLVIIDEKARRVSIGKREVRLAPQPFEVFRYLYLHANEICNKEELLRGPLKGKYDEGYLYTLIGRIRKKIEDDPEFPRYLVTEPNAGHRLIPKPES